MNEKTADETIRFVHRMADECGMDQIKVIFHGGEPLLAPRKVLQILLAGISESADIPVRFSIQSNLWALDDAMLQLLKEYDVEIGTSLDGPKEICDVNRGEGYYERTMASIAKAEKAGCSVDAIATLTKQTLPKTREILTFFRDRGISPVLHCAIRGMDASEATKVPEDTFALTAAEYAEVITDIFPWYIRNRRHIRIPTLDQYCKGAALGDAKVCAMGDCLGMFLAISPTGDITSCQRMAGMPAFTMGNIFNHPSIEQLMDSAPARKLLARQEEVRERCADCSYLDICRGGCYYNAMASGDGVIDPLCEAYMKIYAFLEQRFSEEVGSQENRRALQVRPAWTGGHPLLRSGPYISLTDEVHPSVIADNARQILAAHALAKASAPSEEDCIVQAAHALVDGNICGDIEGTIQALREMRRGMHHAWTERNNCYFHVTFRCNLHCSHCYASAGEETDAVEMSIADLERLAEEAIEMGFRQLIITGGEPLQHKEAGKLLQLCKNLRGHGPNLVLRTNLTGTFTDEQLLEIAMAFDQVVVSIDGSEETHDRRRGKGAYRNVTENCRRYAALAKSMTRGNVRSFGELSLACVMNAKDINGAPGDSLRAFGEELDVKRVRFRPLLPIGRASDMDEPVICEGLGQHVLPEEKLREPFQPLLTCGIGQNIYLCPNGDAYPCYAWQTADSYLGNVTREGLAAVLGGEGFTRLQACTVETIEKCRECEYRYLCGGACRAWGNQREADPNTAPPECTHLQHSARELLNAAYGAIGVEPNKQK